ncbi:MAG: hypothetical protein U0169_08795 [Polyangiaceae bacterium]
MRLVPNPLAMALAALAAVVAISACSTDGTPCYPGDYIACDCGAGKSGLSQCVASGEGYGACDCSGRVPGVTVVAPAATSDAGPTDDAGSDAGGLLPFMSPCETNEQCDTGLCFLFNAKGPHCSKACTNAAECPAPSTGCNNMGTCKAP